MLVHVRVLMLVLALARVLAPMLVHVRVLMLVFALARVLAPMLVRVLMLVLALARVLAPMLVHAYACACACACTYHHTYYHHRHHITGCITHALARQVMHDVYDKLPANAKKYIKVCLSSILRTKLSKCMREPASNVRILRGKPGTPIPKKSIYKRVSNPNRKGLHTTSRG